MPPPPAPAPPPLAPAPPPTAYPAPAYPPPPAYPTPIYATAGYGYAAAPAAHGPSRRLWLAISAGTAALVLLLGAAAYGLGGYLFATNRISNAALAISSASSHRVSINTSFEMMAAQISSFDSTDATTSKATSRQLVSDSQTMASTVAADTRVLRSAGLRLDDLPWLTAFNRGGLKDEADRVEHATKALADVKASADDSQRLGQFMEAYFQVEIDLTTFVTDIENSDQSGAANAYSSLRTDTPNALQLVSVPGLPPEFHDFLVAIQAYAADLRQESIASAAGDQNAIAAARKLALADFDKAVAIDFAGTTATIRAYYQQYRDDFNAEMDKATT